MGSSSGEQDGQSALLENIETQDLLHRDGIAIVYNPLIPNDAVPGFDPMAVSTWSFSLERDETEKVLKVAEVWAKSSMFTRDILAKRPIAGEFRGGS